MFYVNFSFLLFLFHWLYVIFCLLHLPLYMPFSWAIFLQCSLMYFSWRSLACALFSYTKRREKRKAIPIRKAKYNGWLFILSFTTSSFIVVLCKFHSIWHFKNAWIAFSSSWMTYACLQSVTVFINSIVIYPCCYFSFLSITFFFFFFFWGA